MIDTNKLIKSADDSSELQYLLKSLFIENERIMLPLMNALEDCATEEYLNKARQVMGGLSKIYDGNFPQYINSAIKGLQFHSIEFLRLQAAFNQTQEYAADSAEQVFQDVYDCEEVMQQYLDGLLLTYIAWPNHYKLINFFEDNFLSNCPTGSCLEVGPGHGFLSLKLLQQDCRNHLLGLDISPHSVRYTDNMIQKHGIDSTRFEIIERDATKGLNISTKFDVIIVAEVLEHIARPDLLLQDVAMHAENHTHMFMSTVVNIESIDHLYLYTSLEEITTMFNDCGLEIIDQLNMPLNLGNVEYDAYEVGLICKLRK